ncbi:MAG: ACP phosphodiesterase [Chitinophagaceae bacterium]
MNYLAHAYLSFNQPEILVGNMISDFVKGKKKFDYAPGIQKGIGLHRDIDNFTDTHAANRAAKDVFRPVYRLYSGALVDVVYDHFLAIDSNVFTTDSLLQFSVATYATLTPFLTGLPMQFQAMFPYMRQQNWLNNYQYNWAIERSLAGVVRRAVYLTASDPAFQLFEKHYAELQSCYAAFFPELKKFALEQLPVH